MSSEELSNKSKEGFSRREILKKYGSYTTPVVVSLLIPANTYANSGHPTGLASCIASGQSTGHCQAHDMFGGGGGGMDMGNMGGM